MWSILVCYNVLEMFCIIIIFAPEYRKWGIQATARSIVLYPTLKTVAPPLIAMVIVDS